MCGHVLRHRACLRPRRSGVWLTLAATLAVLAALDVFTLAHLDRVAAALPVALRQPLVAATVIALCLMPPLAVRAAERARRPRLFIVRQSGPATAARLAPSPGRRRIAR